MIGTVDLKRRAEAADVEIDVCREREPMSRILWLLATGAIGYFVARSMIDLGSLLTLCAALFVPTFAVLFVRGLPAGVATVFGSVPAALAEQCPRCTSAPRTPTGWCAGCNAALYGAGRPAAPVVVQFNAAADADDWASVRACLAPRIEVGLPNGVRKTVSRRKWLRNNRLLAFTTRSHNHFEAVHGDPGDPSTSWTRTQSTIASRLGGPPVIITTVTRLRHDATGIVEMAQFAELPSAERVAAGWVSAPQRAA